MSQPRLVPEFISELFQAATVGARTVRKTAEGVERIVDGIDEIASLSLEQKKKELLKELAPT